MKPALLLLLTCTFACNTHTPKQAPLTPAITKDSITVPAPPPPKTIALPDSKEEREDYYIHYDTVTIISDGGDTLVYDRSDFNDIVENFPELKSFNPLPPDDAYGKKIVAIVVHQTGKEERISFGSEAGRDHYYMLYAYFLKNKLGIAKYQKRRKRLWHIYQHLNNIYGSLNNGGTYFGHMFKRIDGYAAFSAYWFKYYEDFYDRTYSITQQKKHYLNGLQQMIADEISIDYGMSEDYKIKKQQRLSQHIKALDTLITDYFYLRMAQSFQSENY